MLLLRRINKQEANLLLQELEAYIERIGKERVEQSAATTTAKQVKLCKVHETGRVYDADLEDISQRQEQLWEGVKEILTQLSEQV